MTITIPPDLEAPLALAAKQQGATPELIAVESLRRLYGLTTQSETGTLAEFLSGYVGTVAGAAEPLSEGVGRRFAEMLDEERSRDAS